MVLISNSLNLGSALNALSTSPDGTLVCAGGREVLKIISIDQKSGILSEHMNLRIGKANLNYSVVDLKWHPVEAMKHLIATAPTTGAVVLWNLHKKHSKLDKVFQEHQRTVNKVVWKPSEMDTLLSGSQDNTVKMWDIRQPTSAFTFNCSSEVRDVQFSPHYTNFFAAALDSGSIFIWDIRKPEQPLKAFNGAHNGMVLGIDWHHTNKSLLASAGGRDRLVKVWDMNQMSKPTHVIQNIAVLSHVLWRPEYASQLTTSAHTVDTSVHIWDLDNPYFPLHSFKHHKDIVTGIHWLHGSPDYLLSCSKDFTLALQHVSNSMFPKKYMNVNTLSWSVNNDLMYYNEKMDRTDPVYPMNTNPFQLSSMLHKKTPRASQAKVQTDGRVRFVEWKQCLQREQQLNEKWEDDTLEAMNSCDVDTVKYFAQHYNLFDGTLEEKCSHNAKVAAHKNKASIQKVWEMLPLLLMTSLEDKTGIVVENTPLSILKTSASLDFENEFGEEKMNQSFDSENETTSNKVYDSSSVKPFGLDEQQSQGEQQSLSEEDELLDEEFEESSEEKQTDLLTRFADAGFLSTAPTYETDFNPFNSLKTLDSMALFGMEEKNVVEEDGDDEPNTVNNVHNLSVNTNQITSPIMKSPNPTMNSISSPQPLQQQQSQKVIQAPQFKMTKKALQEQEQPMPPFCNIIQDVLDYYNDIGDIQTCVAIAAALQDRIHFDSTRLMRWYFGYVDLLRRLKLFVYATEVIKYAPHKLVNQMNQSMTLVKTACGTCGALMEGLSTHCTNEKCQNKRKTTCVMCHLPLRGAMLWCQKCGYGGHLHHMVDYLQKHNRCPHCNVTLRKFQAMHDG